MKKTKLSMLLILALLFSLIFSIPAFAEDPSSTESEHVIGKPLDHKDFTKMISKKPFSAQGSYGYNPDMANIYVYGNEIARINDDYMYTYFTGIEVDNVTDLYGASIDLHFDPTMIQVEYVYRNDVFDAFEYDIDNIEGVVNITMTEVGPTSDIGNYTWLCDIEWRPISTGVINWSVTADKNAVNMDQPNICIQLANSDIVDPSQFGQNQIPYVSWSHTTHIVNVYDTAVVGYAYGEDEDEYPIIDANVEIYQGGNFITSTVTDENGYFEIPRADIPVEGEYQIRFSKLGYDGEGYTIYIDNFYVEEVWAWMNPVAEWDSVYDLDGNNIIDIYDIVYVAKHVDAAAAYNQKCDFNNDGMVDWDDLYEIQKRYNMTPQ